VTDPSYTERRSASEPGRIIVGSGPRTRPIVTESSAATAADLTVDSCVRAIGAKNSGGVVQATALTIQPTDATGSCTFSRAGGLGGFGGFGGRPGAGGSPPTNG